ncbi:MAG TPA: cation diffusion facilitator family transporter [Ktedonobacteraceae bacterium]|nr:cation diffusion facilitator family transporter [Ktedonobacteraceae bacterium]
MSSFPKDASREKVIVALSSVAAAVGLVSFKIIVAWLTGSLGILAEAAHSGLDLVASLITLLAIRVAERPADQTHHYGHAKVENLSALLEALLLLLTALWIIYEAIRRLVFHEGNVEISIWAFLVMFLSIGVDAVRSRALLRVARKVGSQALEADALNFQADLWSSSFVIVGLLIVWLAEQFHLPSWLTQADAVAALSISAFVIWNSGRLAKAALDPLLDRAPEQFQERVKAAVEGIEGVVAVDRLRLRRTGNKFFTDVVVAAPRTFTFEQTHTLTEQIEQAIQTAVKGELAQGEVDSVIHIEPTRTPEETVSEQIHLLAERHNLHAHNIHLREVNGYLEAEFDLEVPVELDLEQAHTAASALEAEIKAVNSRLSRVTTHLEAPTVTIVPQQEVTDQESAMVARIRQLADSIAGHDRTHDVHLYQPRSDGVPNKSTSVSGPFDLVLHITCDTHVPLPQAHLQAEEIELLLRETYPQLASVMIHTEPPGE